MIERSHRPRILKPDASYTFCRYFELRFAPADILRELGANLTRAAINLPVASPSQLTRLSDLHQRLEDAIARVSLTSEAARREVLVAPILLEVANITEATINIEYPIEVDQYLKGDLDYYLQSQHNILVVEAKQADMTRGFTQLAVELIALDRWVESNDLILYGAVTTGDIWQFGSFHSPCSTDYSRPDALPGANRLRSVDANLSENSYTKLVDTPDKTDYGAGCARYPIQNCSLNATLACVSLQPLKLRLRNKL